MTVLSCSSTDPSTMGIMSLDTRSDDHICGKRSTSPLSVSSNTPSPAPNPAPTPTDEKMYIINGEHIPESRLFPPADGFATPITERKTIYAAWQVLPEPEAPEATAVADSSPTRAYRVGLAVRRLLHLQ